MTIKTIALTVGISAGVLAVVACNTSAAPSACVQAAEQAGLPTAVIEQLENPGDLNALERIALRRALEQAGLDDICSDTLSATSSSPLDVINPPAPAAPPVAKENRQT